MRRSQTAARINAMKDRSLSPMEKTAREIAARLRESGHIAYFAGGCVRDIVRGETPKDFDIATDARPEIVETLFAYLRSWRAFWSDHRVGKRFPVRSRDLPLR